MMKLILIVIFMMFMGSNNLFFYYNLCFLLSFLMLFMYNLKINNYWLELSYYYGMDFYSYFLIMLSFWIIGLMFMSLFKEVYIDHLKIFLFLFMLLILIAGFSSKNLLMFYFFFEISLIPTFILVIYFGSNPERLSAGYYLLMYTMMISMPLLVYLFNIFILKGSLDFLVCGMYFEGGSMSIWKFYMILLAFFIKMPMYLFHVWLPKAHVEAPVYGSMILAGVLLKLGSYGLLRLLMMLKLCKYNYYIYALGLLGGLIVSMFCLVQVDMKMLVAYSSVVHMNMMLSSMMTMSKISFLGAYIMMIAHGLCSSGMFFMVNFYYIRTGSRLLLMNKGLVNIMSSVVMLWFILCIMNFSFPLSLNFFSEILMMMSIIMYDLCMMLFLMMMSFMSSAYSLYLFSYVSHGDIYFINKFNSGLMIEYLVIIFHFFPLLLLLLSLHLM